MSVRRLWLACTTKDFFDVSEWPIFAKVKSFIYHILLNLIPVITSQVIVSLEPNVVEPHSSQCSALPGCGNHCT